MSSYYDEDDELDIRIHRGRVSPAPVIYPEHRYQPAPRPYYDHHGSSYLVPAVTSGLRRSRSTGGRSPPPPPPQPVIINNRIYNDNYEDEEYALAPPHHHSRSRSRSRPSSFVSSREDYELERTRKELEAYKRSMTREEYEMEKTRKELERYKIEEEREKEAKRLKKEMELQKLRDEKRADEEEKRLKKETEEAIEKYKLKEAEKAAKEKKEKEEREKEYKHRLEEDLRKSGLEERQIAVVLKKEQAIDPNRPTYTRMSRRHLSIETLNRYRIDYEFDQVRLRQGDIQARVNSRVQDPDYVLIKRWVPEYEQDFLWSHTREIRERRKPVLVAIEGKKKHHEEVEFEFVRKKEHHRKPSPSPLLTFLAGGKR
jgi:hypothetical protein